MVREKNFSARLIRLGRILRMFLEKDKISTSWLSRYFETTSRTIQRDLLLLKESGFPLNETKKGYYTLRKDLVKNLEVFEDTELALVIALKELVAQLGQPFAKAAEGVFDRLYECVAAMPVFVKIDDSIPLDNRMLSRSIRAIREKRQVSFSYESSHGMHPAEIEPYRIAYFGGFWYLIGKDLSTSTVKRYALDKITDLKLSRNTFKAVPDTLDATLQGSANIWFSEEQDLEVTVLINACVSHYFKRRKMFPTQEIKEERMDGSLVVTFRMGQYEAIRNVLKSWIPNIVVLEPEDFKQRLIKDIKDWLKYQEKGVF